MSTQHKDIVNAELHEPKGISSATSGTVYQADGNGSGVWVAPAPGAESITSNKLSSDLLQMNQIPLIAGNYDYYQIDNLGNSADINSDVETNSTTYVDVASVRVYIHANATEIGFDLLYKVDDATYSGSIKLENAAATLSVEVTGLTTTSFVSLKTSTGAGGNAIDVSGESEGWQVFNLKIKTTNAIGRTRIQSGYMYIGTSTVVIP